MMSHALALLLDARLAEAQQRIERLEARERARQARLEYGVQLVVIDEAICETCPLRRSCERVDCERPDLQAGASTASKPREH